MPSEHQEFTAVLCRMCGSDTGVCTDHYRYNGKDYYIPVCGRCALKYPVHAVVLRFLGQ